MTWKLDVFVDDYASSWLVILLKLSLRILRNKFSGYFLRPA
jgi:hypothetical protein